MKIPLQNGPLAEFITRKMASYQEPSRKGTPKGEAIGFSQLKHTAMLLALTNTDLRQVAKNLVISYGLLRKWRTEADFKKLMSSHAEEFVDELIEALQVKVEKNNKAFREFLSGPFRQLQNGWSKKIDINELIVGAASWGAPINFALVERASSFWLRDSNHDDQISMVFPLGDLIDSLCEAQGESPVFAHLINRELRKYESMLWISTIDFVMEGLEKGMSLQHRKKAIFRLGLLKKRLERMGSQPSVADLLGAVEAELARREGTK